MRLLAFLILCASAAAQDKPAEEAPKPGAISGTVTIAGTGAPMPDVQVSVRRGTPQEKMAVTDQQGRYTLRDLAPGPLRISASAADSSGRVGGFGPTASRQLTLAPGQDLSSVDFQMVIPGRISGKVLDQNKEPVVGISVLLVVREYSHGALRAVFAGTSNTDDQGEYTIERVLPGRAYAVMASRRMRTMSAISDAPLDPAMRLPAVVPTYYPSSPTLDGAEPLNLRPGELRENVDIRLARSPSFCLEGVLEGNSGPAALRFNISETQPASGTSGSGGFYMATPGATSGPDGKVRICDLHPGDYELSISQYPGGGGFAGASHFGAMVVTISDRDVAGIRLGLRPRIPVSGEVVFDGPAPETSIESKLRLDLQAITRTERGSIQASIPGEFAFEGGLLMEEYGLNFAILTGGMYVKDVTYGDRSILNRTLRVGTALGNASLRIVIGREGGTVAAKVADKDGNPVVDCTVVVMPASVEDEATFAAVMRTGQTDQSGRWTSPPLAPGKYIALATKDVVNRSPEVIAKLWKARNRGEEIDLVASGKPSISLSPKSFD